MKIKKVVGREILDSRGIPTLECDMFLSNGSFVRSSVPSGLSTGKYEAVELIDKDKNRFFGKGKLNALKNLEEKIAPILIEREPDLQKMEREILELDGTENKSILGANTILAAGIAIARSQSIIQGCSLVEFVADNFKYDISRLSMPYVMFNILNGGVHAHNNLDIQEFMIMPKLKEGSFLDYLEKAVRVYQNLKDVLLQENLNIGLGDEGGFAPFIKCKDQTCGALDLLMRAIEVSGLHGQIDICLDVAASEFYDYKRGIYKFEHKDIQVADMVDYYEMLIDKYPIYSIEDGLAEEDWQGWRLLTSRLGNKVQLVGDDLFVTNLERIKKGVELNAGNAVLIKPNQIGSVSQTFEAIKYCHDFGYKTVVSHRSGDTCDSFISDLVVGSMSSQFKSGAPVRGERVAKYNQLLRIEEQL